MRKEGFRLASGERVDGYTVNHTSPGPVIHAVQGQLVEVRLVNASVPDGVTLHWHGVDVPNAEDGVAGVTQDAVPVGKSFTYRFVADQVGTYWYHSHQVSHAQVQGGLLGALVVAPPTPDPDVLDQLAVLHVYDGTPTVNGASGVVPVDVADGTRVRVRVVNTDNGAAPVWVSGSPYRVLAVDGYDLNGPTPVSGKAVRLTAGGRVDLEVTAPARIELGGATTLALGSEVAAEAQPTELVDLLRYGTPAPLGFDPSHADRSFEYSIGRRPGFLDGRPGLWWSINGHLFPDVPMYVVQEGDVVRMHIENHSRAVHPMHLHGHHAVVLVARRREGDRQPVVDRLARRRQRPQLRHRVRGGQPRDLDGPLPQPAARRPGAGGAPDVRRGHRAVPGRRRRGQRARVTAGAPARVGSTAVLGRRAVPGEQVVHVAGHHAARPRVSPSRP